jgi:hypothetical protein
MKKYKNIRLYCPFKETEKYEKMNILSHSIYYYLRTYGFPICDKQVERLLLQYLIGGKHNVFSD